MSDPRAPELIQAELQERINELYGELAMANARLAHWRKRGLLAEAAVQAAGSVAMSEPIPMYLTCPKCNARHIDEGEFATKSHTTHSCQACGLTFRLAVVPTVGVQFLPGFKNEDSPEVACTKDAVLAAERVVLDACVVWATCDRRDEADRTLTQALAQLDEAAKTLGPGFKNEPVPARRADADEKKRQIMLRLLRAWKAKPGLRLGQLLYNASYDLAPPAAPFRAIEDDALVELVEKAR